MIKVEETTQGVLDKISEGFEQKGAYNLRQNGISVCHGDSEHIKIRKKEDKPGIDIFIDGKTQGEKVFIPVVVSVSGMTDLVYNDFYVEDGVAHVTCEPCQHIYFQTPHRGDCLFSDDGDCLTEGSFALNGDEEYVRVTIKNSRGQKAWTQPIWLWLF